MKKKILFKRKMKKRLIIITKVRSKRKNEKNKINKNNKNKIIKIKILTIII